MPTADAAEVRTLEQPPARRRSLLLRGVAFLAAVVVVRIGAGPLLRAAPALPAPFQGALNPVGPLALLGAFALLTVVFTRVEGVSARSLGLAPRRRFTRDFLAGAALSAATFGVATLLCGWIAGVAWSRNPVGSPVSALAAALTFAVAALGDELANRGYGFRRLYDAAGLWPAQLAVALLIAVLHWSPGVPPHVVPFLVVIPAVSSLLFGYAYVRTGQLGLAAGLHAGGNWITLSVLDGRADPSRFGFPPGLWRPSAPTLSPVAADLYGVLLPTALAMVALTIGIARWRGTSGRLAQAPALRAAG